MKKCFLLILLLYTLFSSCSENNESSKQNNHPYKYSVLEEPYEYSNELIRYFKDIFNFELTQIESKFVFFIPVNSCSPCVEKTIFGLNDLKYQKNIRKIIIVGNPSDSIINANIEILKGKYTDKILIDEKSMLFRYELNIGGPTILIFENHSPKLQLNLSEETWIKKKEYLPFLN